jgi:NAD(P)H-dependent FMN reductase
MLNIALIVGSTRPNRFADHPARWIQEGASERRDFRLSVLDLRDEKLPLFNEPVSPFFTNGAYSNPLAENWRHKIGRFDGFIATVAEYNHGPTAVLKNAFDSAFIEWREKPIAFVGYGGVGGARAVEQLRLIAVELQMAPIRNAVHIGMSEYLGVVQDGRTLDSYPHLNSAREMMFDQLAWWTRVLKAGREAEMGLDQAAE